MGILNVFADAFKQNDELFGPNVDPKIQLRRFQFRPVLVPKAKVPGGFRSGRFQFQTVQLTVTRFGSRPFWGTHCVRSRQRPPYQRASLTPQLVLVVIWECPDN